MRIEPDQIVNGGTYTENVENHGTIRGGVFTGKVDSFGGIEGGEFKGEVEVHQHSSISGGEFFGFVKVDGTINNGKFFNKVDLFGDINGGEFFDTVAAFEYSLIKDGIFQGEVDLYVDASIQCKEKVFGPIYLIVLGHFKRKVLVKPAVENFTDEIRKNNDYPAIMKKAMEKIIEEKNSYLGDQNDKNPLDLLALTQDFNDNIL